MFFSLYLMIFKYDFYLGNKKYIKNQALVSYVQLTNIIECCPYLCTGKKKKEKKKKGRKATNKT